MSGEWYSKLGLSRKWISIFHPTLPSLSYIPMHILDLHPIPSLYISINIFGCFFVISTFFFINTTEKPPQAKALKRKKGIPFPNK
jgi:hypothetical protein